MLIVRGVNLYPSQIEDLLLQVRHLAPHYLLEVDRGGNLDSLTVHIEPTVEATATDCSAAALQLEKLVKSQIGISVTVKLETCGSIIRSHGKAQHVIDKRRRE
jgi:phenylacetate-CoA ligase